MTLFNTSSVSKILRSDFYSKIVVVLVLLSIAFGIYFRLKGLGKSPFTVDEYYIASSIKNILEHGLPEFDCGGYYIRGLLLQYSAVPFFIYGGNDEYWLRFITVCSNLAALPAIFLLGKRIAGKDVAYLAVLLFSLSIWEIEFARFARMYAPFQAIFIWYLFFLYRRIYDGNLAAGYWMFLLSFTSIFIYEGAIFPVLLNFMIFFTGTRRASIKDAFFILTIFSIAYLFLTYDFRYLGVESYFPDDLAYHGSNRHRLPIELPNILALTLESSSIFLTLYTLHLAASLLIIGYLSIKVKSYHDLEYYHVVLFSFLIFLALANMFTLVIGFFIIAVLLEHIHPEILRYRPVVLSIIAIVALFIFWLVYGLFSSEWLSILELENPDKSQLKQLLVVLFKYPDIPGKFIYPWFFSMPAMTISSILIVTICAALVIIRNDQDNYGFKFFLAISTALVLLSSVLIQPYRTTRYTFFIYPILLLLIISSLNILTSLAIKKSCKAYKAFIFLTLIFIIISEDFGFDHLFNIDSNRIIYRTDYNHDRAGHYYPRWDFRTVGQYIHDRIEPSDIVVSSARVIHYYLNQMDYYYVEKNAKKLNGILACKGTKDLWSNANLIYQDKKLEQLLETNPATIWLVLRSYRWISDFEKNLAIKYKKFHTFESFDKNLNVFRIPAKK
ncbi:MAG: hypothetical protein CSA09_04875 [Candidatus Contendobacter odensis]|uniref:Glycosyltransferase RgtA/B/C/D-like domain-containing protein n=1 Tax=Candidatus Contendibacter odensensis TaxID=1400860 RepID=A0A2G6PEB8_9GAMM|nr:MAG: hypothetical protein CSA09_04875 [Candidatus Contendobacter odensis]